MKKKRGTRVVGTVGFLVCDLLQRKPERKIMGGEGEKLRRVEGVFFKLSKALMCPCPAKSKGIAKL